MAAGGFREFVAGETLDEEKINDFLMQGILVFAGTAARGSAITAPVEGQFAFLKDDDSLTFYDGSDWVGLEVAPIATEYLVIAGGGAGSLFSSGAAAGGGGAGGYRCNVSGENSGGGETAEDALSIPPGTYPLTVGAGGASSSTLSTPGTKGSDSQFFTIHCEGGGAGATITGGDSGGSGGGAYRDLALGKNGKPGQGFKGGNGNPSFTGAAGGGGAGAVGANTTGAAGSNGGNGVASTITGSSVTRAGGGGGGGSTGSGGTGGSGGGGNGTIDGGTAGSGQVNTGSGGGGGEFAGTSGAGGSGVIVLRFPEGTNISFSGGVTQSSTTSGGKDIYTVTATSTISETITIG